MQAPSGRAKPSGSSWPFNSPIVVSRVQMRPSFSRMWPKPRATSVSKGIQASMMPSASETSSPSASAQLDGLVEASCLSACRAPGRGLPCVLMFQVKVTRSRQKQSSWKSPTAFSISPEESALPKASSRSVTRLFGRLVEHFILPIFPPVLRPPGSGGQKNPNAPPCPDISGRFENDESNTGAGAGHPDRRGITAPRHPRRLQSSQSGRPASACARR